MTAERRFLPQAQAQRPLFLGVDLGGTSVKLGVVDNLGRPLSWLSIPTNCPAGPEQGARRIGAAVLEVVKQAGVAAADIALVGLGSPGPMDVAAGVLLDSPNLQGWEDFPIIGRVADVCGLPILFVNDAGAAAYGEYWIGCGQNHRSMVMLTLGTGIGGGIIVDDRLIDGENNTAAELGHTVIDWHDDARWCGCGQTGHLEAYASATALIKRADEALAVGLTGSLQRRVAAGEPLTPLLIGQEAEAGDPLAERLVMDTAKYIGIACTTFVHTIDPSCLVIGGAMTFGGNATPLGRRFLEAIGQQVRQKCFPIPAQRVEIVYATLGSDAGYIGAAGLARVAHLKEAQA
ncbi:MAG TPA: ROK family protein [Pirellulales bacterium]|nr:ROK family protein [Pirellulales bacterium]